MLALSLICTVALIVMVASLCVPRKAEQEPFTPPPFDENALSGTPDVPENTGYSILYRGGMSYQVGICGRINIVDGSAEVYLTNVEENNAWLKVRFYDADGSILGESGLIKPGEYLKSVRLQRVPNETEGIVVKVMSYEPDTYKSLGSVTVTPKISVITP